jgi:hypothetical protein
MAKKQHYIPRLLLRDFSTDRDGKLINIHLLNENRLLQGSLYEQAQKNYLYGADQKLEKIYEKLENETAPAIRKLSNKKFDLTNEERLHLKLFIMYQMNRTPGNVDLLNNNIESVLKNIASHNKHLKNHLSDITVGINNPYIFLFRMATRALHVILDLHIGLLESDNRTPFVLGQNPVIRLNPFLKAKGWRGSTQGLILKGAMIIMPISPQYSVILYDNHCYTFVNKNPKWKIDNNDINLLNYLQYLNTNECIYFNYNSDINYYNNVSHETQAFREGIKTRIEVLKRNMNKKDGIEEIMNSGLEEYPIMQKFNFFTFKHDAFLEQIDNLIQARREVMPNFIEKEINHRIQSRNTAQ